MNGTALAGKRKWSGLGRTHAVTDTIDVPGEGVASPASKRSKRALQDDEDDLLKHLDAGYEMENARYRDEDARREGNGDILRDGVDDLSVRSIAATVLMTLKAGGTASTLTHTWMQIEQIACAAMYFSISMLLMTRTTSTAVQVAGRRTRRSVVDHVMVLIGVVEMKITLDIVVEVCLTMVAFLTTERSTCG
jgi:hypothetical protein